MSTTWKVNNATALGGEVCAPWQTGHAYSLGARCVCRTGYGTAAARAFVFECTTAGNSAASTEPTWPTTPGSTVADGPDTLVWTCRSPITWDNASCILDYISENASNGTAGDIIHVNKDHNENATYNTTYVLRGSKTPENPVLILCVNKADDSLATGAIVVAAAFNDLRFYNYLISYGVKYKTDYGSFQARNDSDSGALVILYGGGTTVLEGNHSGSLSSSQGYYTGCEIRIINGNINALQTSFYIKMDAHWRFNWKVGSLLSAGGITHLFDDWGQPRLHTIEDVDLSGMGSGAELVDLLDATHASRVEILLSGCKLPSTPGFALTRGTWPWGGMGKIRLHHCSSANATYDFHEESAEGTVDDETTIVKTSGASDGTTPQSWKMVSSAKVKDNYHYALESPPITIWNTAATSKTFTIEGILDSLTNLQNDEVWMELEYPANNTDGLGAVATEKCAFLGTPADKPAGVGSGGWTTTGLTNPNSFKFAVTVTPGKAGPVTARIYLAKPSTTIYVDPLITVS